MSHKYKLKADHPFAKKVAELFETMDRLGIRMEVGTYETIITDTENNKEYVIKDIEASGINNSVLEFPYRYEYKLTFESPVDLNIPQK
jgi:hypothetical protein